MTERDYTTPYQRRRLSYRGYRGYYSDKPNRHHIISEATREFLAVIFKHCPNVPEKDTAIMKIEEAKMWGNFSIAMTHEDPVIDETLTHEEIRREGL